MIKKLAALVLALLIGLAIGRFSAPEKVVTKEIEVIKRDIKIVERKVTRPDGTIEETKETIDKSNETSKSDTFVYNRPDWLVQASVQTDFNKPIYGLAVSRRIFGGLSVGVSLNSRLEPGVVVGLEF